MCCFCLKLLYLREIGTMPKLNSVKKICRTVENSQLRVWVKFQPKNTGIMLNLTYYVLARWVNTFSVIFYPPGIELSKRRHDVQHLLKSWIRWHRIRSTSHSLKPVCSIAHCADVIIQVCYMSVKP